MTGVGSTDVFIAKLNTSGVQQWYRIGGSTNADTAAAMVLDGSGNVYVAGTVFASTTLGGRDFSGATTGTNFFGATATTSSDIYLVQLNASGVQQQFNVVGSIGAETVRTLRVDALGNFVVAGTFTNTVDFDPSANVVKPSFLRSAGCLSLEEPQQSVWHADGHGPRSNHG